MDSIKDRSFRTLTKIANRIGVSNVPSYVGEHTPCDEKRASTLCDSEFADSIGREYPVITKADTWLSAAYYLDKHAEDGVEDCDVWGAIKSAAALWGAGEDIKKLEEDLKSSKIAKDKKGGFGLVLKSEGADVNRYPMFDAEGVEKAASYFDANRANYPSSIRMTLANAILKHAGEFEVSDLPNSVYREAGCGIPRKSLLIRELDERAEMAKSAEAKELLSNVSRLIGAINESELLDNASKIAEAVCAFDELEELDKAYGQSISYPADFVYSVQEKDAEEFCEKAVPLRGLVFDAGALLAEKSAMDAIESAIGPKLDRETVDSPVKLAKLINGLKSEDKRAIYDAITESCTNG
jgi:hypothetical protein